MPSNGEPPPGVIPSSPPPFPPMRCNDCLCGHDRLERFMAERKGLYGQAGVKPSGVVERESVLPETLVARTPYGNVTLTRDDADRLSGSVAYSPRRSILARIRDFIWSLGS